MRFAYLTADDVNLDLARRWAQEYGCTLAVVSPSAPLRGYDAVICDLDYFSPALRQLVMNRLLNADARSPVVVHSYNLEPRQISALRARGIFVQRRLERETIGRLAAQRGSAAARMRPRHPDARCCELLAA